MGRTCKWEGYKITKRQNVTCRKAKRVLKGEFGPADKVPGWNCKDDPGLIPEGRCRKGENRKFKYRYVG